MHGAFLNIYRASRGFDAQQTKAETVSHPESDALEVRPRLSRHTSGQKNDHLWRQPDAKQAVPSKVVDRRLVIVITGG
mgnify:CR=1 FL=1